MIKMRFEYDIYHTCEHGSGDHRGRGRTVVGFTTTYAINVYHQ